MSKTALSLNNFIASFDSKNVLSAVNSLFGYSQVFKKVKKVRIQKSSSLLFLNKSKDFSFCRSSSVSV